METIKILGVGMLLVGVMGTAIYYGESLGSLFDKEVIKETQTIVEVQTVDSLADRIKTAQEAAQDATEASAQALYDEYIEKELKRIEDEIKIEYIAEVEATIEDPAY